MWTTLWWGINDEDSELCGEEFFTELLLSDGDMKAIHTEYAKSIFPDVKLTCYGAVTEYEAEMMGLDTY